MPIMSCSTEWAYSNLHELPCISHRVLGIRIGMRHTEAHTRTAADGQRDFNASSRRRRTTEIFRDMSSAMSSKNDAIRFEYISDDVRPVQRERECSHLLKIRFTHFAGDKLEQTYGIPFRYVSWICTKTYSIVWCGKWIIHETNVTE